MAYKLYTDVNENFECEVSVKNASMKGSFARLIIESPDNVSLVFHGKIEGDKCIVPVHRLKGVLDENTRGKMHLEVVVEDTYFKPWESDFVVEEHTSVKVKVTEQAKKSNKPILEVKVHPLAALMDSDPTDESFQERPFSAKRGINVFVPLKEISSLCSLFQINKKNIKQKKNDFSQLLKEYFDSNPEYKNHQIEILNGIGAFLK